MTTATKLRYIEYLYPGLMVGETSTKELTGLDEHHLQMPEGAIAWRTFERASTEIDGEKLLGEIKNRSGWTYYGRRMTLEQVEREMPNERILIDNMRGSYDAIVQTPQGRCFPLNADDRVLAPRS